MKRNTMTIKLTTIAIIAALLANAHAAPPGAIANARKELAEKHANKPAELATALATFDAQRTKELGEGWRERLAKRTKPEIDELADIYTEGRSFITDWRRASAAAKDKLIAHIATKRTLNENDLTAVTALCNAGSHHPAMVARMDELLALTPKYSTNYFRLKYVHLLGMGGGWDGWKTYMLPEEWLQFASSSYSPDYFTDMRQNLLAMITQAMAEKRKAAGESVEGPEFDVAMAPVIAALDAPLFAGLQDATASLMIELPVMDHAATVASAEATVFAIERHAISEKEATKKLGTVMFVKGVAAYNEWKNTLTITP